MNGIQNWQKKQKNCFISGQKHLQSVNILNGCRCGKKLFCPLHLQITGEWGNQATDKYFGVILACTAWPESREWEEDLCAGFCSLPDGLVSKEREEDKQREGFTITQPRTALASLISFPCTQHPVTQATTKPAHVPLRSEAAHWGMREYGCSHNRKSEKRCWNS